MLTLSVRQSRVWRSGCETPIAQVVTALNPWWSKNQDSTLPEVLADLIAPRAKDALARSLDTIRTAMVQPVGATPDAKRLDSRCVTDAEFDRAVMVTIAASMAMWLSGALKNVEVVE